MSQVERIERQEAILKEEKKLAKLEDAFVVKKEAGTLTRADKLKLRKNRQDYRDNYRQPKTGAQPAAIVAGAKVKEV